MLLQQVQQLFYLTLFLMRYQFARERDMSDLELDILKLYFSLDKETRTQVLQHFKQKFSSSLTETIA